MKLSNFILQEVLNSIYIEHEKMSYYDNSKIIKDIHFKDGDDVFFILEN